MMKPAATPTVNLSNQDSLDGNAFAIMGCVSKALAEAGADKEYIHEYLNEASSGDYDHLLGVTMEYVNVI